METGLTQYQTISTSSAGFFEYLLIAQPDATVYEQVMAEKRLFTEQYHQQVAIKTKPHITVANFLAREEMEPTLIRWMHRVISTQQRFEVTLNNFSGFSPHTIYLRVQDHDPFRQLASKLKVVDQYVRSYGCPEVKLVSRPHLSIARKLPETVYRQAEQMYAQKNFHASFEVSQLLLLRREHQFDTCRQVNVFGLMP